MFARLTELAESAHGVIVAANDPDGGVITRDTVSPGGIAFLLFVLLGIATFLLWLSMNKQLKRIDFEDESARTLPGHIPPGWPTPQGTPTGGSAADGITPGSDVAAVDLTDSAPGRGADENPER